MSQLDPKKSRFNDVEVEALVDLIIGAAMLGFVFFWCIPEFLSTF